MNVPRLSLSTIQQLDISIAIPIFGFIAVLLSRFAYVICKRNAPFQPPNQYLYISGGISLLGYFVISLVAITQVEAGQFIGILIITALIAVSSFTDGIYKLVFTPIIGAAVLASLWSCVLVFSSQNNILELQSNLCFLALFWLFCTVKTPTQESDDYCLLGASLGVLPLGLMPLVTLYVCYVLFVQTINLIILRKDVGQSVQVAFVPVIYISFVVAVLISQL